MVIKKKKKAVYNDMIYISVILAEKLQRQTALRNGLKEKKVLGQQKLITTPTSLSLSFSLPDTYAILQPLVN